MTSPAPPRRAAARLLALLAAPAAAIAALAAPLLGAPLPEAWGFGAAVFSVAALGFAALRAHALGARLDALAGAVDGAALGSPVVAAPGLEDRDSLGALARAATTLGARAEERSRLTAALDASSTLLMIANTDHDIVYMNAPLAEMLRGAESEIRRDLPAFSAAALIGTNIDVFHKNPAHQRAMIDALTGTHDALLRLGGKQFALAVSPVRDASGARLGAVVEWRDVTAERRAVSEIDAVVAAAVDGEVGAARE
ncbi:MAG: PAS domain-containing protein, partial [Pseudomonadota bacterium]